MGPEEIAFVKAVVIAIGIVGTSLSVYSIRLRHRARGPELAERDMQDQLEQEAARREALEARIAELEERVDFTERRLVQGRQVRETTPV
jgi:hypothetical protein